jgi:ribosomal-protein-serine acetyltransferase
MTYSLIDLRDNVSLRPVRRTDAQNRFACAKRNSERLRPWFFWAGEALNLGEIETYLASVESQAQPRSDYEYGIWNGDEYAGSVGLHKIDYVNRIARIGYWIDAALEGRGYIRQSVHALMELGFNTLHLNRIEIRCAPNNAPSRAVPERLGFTQEGTHRQVLALHGGFQDLIMYAMLARDWRKD